MVVPRQKVAIIGGGGMVGAAAGYALTVLNIPCEIILVDVVELAARGQALDIADASFQSQAKVRTGTFADAGQCDVVVVSAGYPQKPGETRAQLLSKNREIIKSIMTQMQPIKKTMKILVVANPVDVLTFLAQKYSGLPKNQVIGSGTHLDSGRLRMHLSQLLETHPSSIEAYVLGEHGDRQFVGWSSATIAGSPLLSHPKMKDVDLDAVVKEVALKAYTIIDAKRSTYFGVGRCVADIVESLLHNQSRVYPICVYHEKYDAYISWPAAVGATGAEQIYEVPLNEDEQGRMDVAVKAIKEMCEEALQQ
eukprot:Blabericola_migrator_1__6072@NODE_3064_length_2067_cov_643_168500_g1915_i0_p1_GENE_NODE_3064_length_2067_cov_643_168500_g1915_i0NODE_3064_length_2067_cov_643_168500_g1915_i0_p1_ORF_typecomplete_len308_score57_15Ldh_1_N/PF00056_23/5_2e37Ldh_1_C/PF02866_18/1_7e30DUF3447/PF11929_8/0_037Epimerase/PF01370_21/0_026Semialdhyde_dh/PF01118_24/0_34Semialdhyde_dh/PF01118_24/1_7e03FAD_binding_3/PF01494_19/0_11_NODE_3064_length_2067_cov_643_168500_g1915_i01421065